MWGFNHGDDTDGLGSSLLAVGYDDLHNIPLGVWCYIVNEVLEYLTSVYGKPEAQRRVAEMNRYPHVPGVALLCAWLQVGMQQV